MFFEVLVSLLGKHGVAIRDVNVTETGVVKIDIDFTEHDKVFEDKIAKLELKLQRVLSQKKDHEDTIACYVEKTEELKQRIAELESKETVELPFNQLETANMLINATYSRKTSNVEKAFTGCNAAKEDIYSIDDLEQIAEHLLVYCKHNKESEE